ncbi:MAG: hypothetical protein AAFQ16_11020 [Pseudomonadota bacterium]
MPLREEDQHIAAYKISKRFDQDISAVCVGVSCLVRDGLLTDVRIALGGMAGIVKRASASEAALEGKTPDADRFEQAAVALSEDFTPLTDMRASADYRLRVAANLIRRFGKSLDETQEPLEVYDYGR